jgi:hypothetical protein
LLIPAVVLKAPRKSMRLMTGKKKRNIFVNTAGSIVPQFKLLLIQAVVQKARLNLISLIPALKKQSMFASIAELIVLQFKLLLIQAVVQKVQPNVITRQDSSISESDSLTVLRK